MGLAAMLLLPGTPLALWVLLPVLLCGFVKNWRTEIVFLSTLVGAIFFHQHFFSIHLFSFSLENSSDLLTKQDFFSAGSPLLYSSGILIYLVFFAVLFKIHKMFSQQLTFASTTLMSLAILGFIWVSKYFLNFQNSFTIALALGGLVLSRCAFYIFNYILFFEKLPSDRKSAAAVIQPFWFLTFEVPENPVYDVVQSDTEKEKVRNVETLKIVATSLLYKLLLVLYFSLWSAYVTGHFKIVLNDIEMVNTVGISFLRDWRNQNAFALLLCLFSYSVSYLGSSFFVYGRLVVATGRLCGFNLPDYINDPWKSHSFADFFSRIMYYYNIVIVNLFFFPALEFSRRFKLSKKARIFVSLNWALMFGGFVTRFLKDVYKVYKFGFLEALRMNLTLAFAYTFVLSLAVSLSLYFETKKAERKTNIARMFFYFFLYSLIMPLNFSMVFGKFADVCRFYLKVLSFGLF